MCRRFGPIVGLFMAVAAFCGGSGWAAVAPNQPAASSDTIVVSTTQTAVPEKDARTPAQRKINSQLLYEIYRHRKEGLPPGVPAGETRVKIDAKQRALVDVRATLTSALTIKLRTLGATIVSTSATYRSTIAWIPLSALERLAADPAVLAIEPAPDAATLR